MANQIIDNRTSLYVAQTSTPASETWEASGGGGSIVEDTDTIIEGTTSVAEQISNNRRVMLFDNGSTQDLSNGHLYLWVNCGIVGLLDIKSNGGLTIRLTGPTSTDFVEWYVGGSDSWPTSIQGGWTMFVVDTASTTSNTGGTPPALTAIQKVGISAVTNGAMTKTADNTWVDAAWFLGDGTPGIIIEGRNGGTTDWTFADINTQLTNSAGTFVQSAGGAWKCNAPIQVGINDTTLHGFTDTNSTVLWDDQEFAATDLYSLSALGNSGGTTRMVLGVKTGTGDDATGAQGAIIQAASTGVRWSMDFDDPNIDDIGFYGCTFIHGNDFQLDDPAVSVIGSLFLDCTSARTDNATDFLRNKVIDANTADGVAFITTDDMSNIRFCEFEFSDGHAIELTTTLVTPQTSKGNLFTGYGGTPGTNLVSSSGSTDAAIYNNAAGAITINVTNAGDTPSIRNGASATTTVNNTVTLTVNVRDVADGTAIPYATVRIEETDGTLVSEGVANNLGNYIDSGYSYGGDLNVRVVVRKSSPGDARYLPTDPPATIVNTGLTLTVPMTLNSNVQIVAAQGIQVTGARSEDESTNAVQTVTVKIPSTDQGSSRKLLVGALYWDSTTNLTTSSFTYDGNAMTNVATASAVEQEGAGNFHEVDFSYYDIPDTDEGDKDVVITWSTNVAIKGLCFALLEDVTTGAPNVATTNTGDEVTTNPSLTLNPSGSAWTVAVGMVDDPDSPSATGVATIKRSDLVVDGLKSMFVVSSDRTAGGSHSVGADYGANSKTWVMGGVSVLKN